MNKTKTPVIGIKLLSEREWNAKFIKENLQHKYEFDCLPWRVSEQKRNNTKLERILD